MAQFYGTLQGGRGAVSRIGHKTTGLTANVNGWSSGVKVNAYHENGQDYFQIVLTDGSGQRGVYKELCVVSSDDITNVNTIKIHISGGCLTEVENLPPNWDYELVDWDNINDKDQ